MQKSERLQQIAASIENTPIGQFTARVLRDWADEVRKIASEMEDCPKTASKQKLPDQTPCDP